MFYIALCCYVLYCTYCHIACDVLYTYIYCYVSLSRIATGIANGFYLMWVWHHDQNVPLLLFILILLPMVIIQQ